MKLPFRFISDWQEMYAKTIKVLRSPEPTFYSRIGGSDTDLVIDYFEGLTRGETTEQILDRVRPHLKIVQEYNGYYDKSGSEINILRYCRELLRCYEELKFGTAVGEKWLTLYFKDNINPIYWVEIGEKRTTYERLLKQIDLDQREHALLPFPFVEKTTRDKWSMFNAFQEILPGKKVLVISPFSVSIRRSFPARNQFFKAYQYPNFQLDTLSTPITYSGLPPELYPHENWFETVEDLKSKLSTFDFDIALMACGSYAMPLGSYIANHLQKKAIYVGGILQLYFGLMGRRYENPFFTDQLNLQYFSRPEERELYLGQTVFEPSRAAEGFGAYF